MPCRRWRRWPLLSWLSVGLLFHGVLLFVVLTRRPAPTNAGARALGSPCRPDMAVRRLPPMSPEDHTMLADLLMYLTRPDPRTCQKKLKFGGIPIRDRSAAYVDGHKYVCLDPELSLLTSDGCLVYSFGISIDWSFDWDMEAFGCTVHAFDPTIPAPNDSAGAGDVSFHQYGIGGRDGVLENSDAQLRTLETLVDRLGHRQSVIHYLKLDVEDGEWAVFQQQAELDARSVLAENVEQLGVELHFMDHQPAEQHVTFYREVYRSLLALQELGFYLFWSEPNPLQRPEWAVPGLEQNITYAMEVVWLKARCIEDAYLEFTGEDMDKTIK
ncbi:Methyltransferase-like protein 24 [Amphibalanus amphitrite]|uniref:Methyltransferase-like protein 24 n=2 Tax=Amphibalanus amphitrite TaxID=1232801 RepID=A0A6A4WQA2_AMPAM|nr:Methyltransferase-like protein 24 [Amphibalanus amphitrite]